MQFLALFFGDLLKEPNADEDQIDYDHKPCDETEQARATHHAFISITHHSVGV
jgi:hypothetical protein